MVYRATELASGSPVALKTIAPELSGDPDFRGRFRRECEILASLDHPNVIAVHEVGDGYVAMQWVEGSTLRELAPLEAARAASIVGQVAGALDLLHARGFVHRDVKPGNVLVGPDDHAYLTDFGLTKEISPDPGLTREGRWLGTVDFAAPEQIRGQPTNARSDVYSLGCVLGFALTGSVPYPRPTPEATMQAHMYEPPPRLLPPLVPFNDVLVRALAKDPAWRFRSAGELGRAATAATGTKRKREPLSRRSVAIAAAAVAAVVGAVVLALVLFGSSDDAGERTDVEELNTSVSDDPASVEDLEIQLAPEGDYPYSGYAYGEPYEGKPAITVDMEIKDPPKGRTYEVWLYNSRRDAISLGTAVPDSAGVLLTNRTLPRGWTDYAYLDLSLEPRNGDERHSGRSVVRGSMTPATGAIPGVDP